MTAHIRDARVDLGGGIKRAPRPTKNYDVFSHDITRNSKLSYMAIGVLVRLLSNEDNVTQTAEDLVSEKKGIAGNRKGMGKRAILSALAELRLTGYMQTFVFRDEDGFFQTISVIFDQPQPIPSGWVATATGVLHRLVTDVGEVDGHESAQVIDISEVRLPTSAYSDFGKRTPKEVSRGVPREKSSSSARAPAAAAKIVEKGKANKEFCIIHGMECWTLRDQQVAEEIYAQHGADAVGIVVSAVRESGASPLPGRVALELQRRARALLERAKRQAEDLALVEQRRADAKAAARPTDLGRKHLAAAAKALRANQSSQERDQ